MLTALKVFPVLMVSMVRMETVSPTLLITATAHSLSFIPMALLSLLQILQDRKVLLELMA